MVVEILPFKIYGRFFDELTSLFADMDRAYADAAAYYGFHCAGCADNCCLTLFYHHTRIEQMHLLNSFLKFDLTKQERIRNRARRVNQQVIEAAAKKESPRAMCALNEDGRCLLYAQRPMICRLHGIPHEFKPPGVKTVFGSGCSEFVRQCSGRGYRVLDRTPFYSAMAGLEQRFREEFGFSGKFKKTVSEMLLL